MNHTCTIITALPHNTGFGHDIFMRLQHILSKMTWNTHVQDLYADHFEAVLSRVEIHRQLPIDDLSIRYAHQLHDASLIVFVFPLWWNMPPAILKGWLDRILSPEFAYRKTERQTAKGLLTGKRSFICTSASNAVREELVTPVWESLLSFCGIRLHSCYIADRLSERNTQTKRKHADAIELAFTELLHLCEKDQSIP